MLVVDARLKLPHWALPQLTAQFTVAFGGPFVIVTASAAVLPGAAVFRDAGGAKPEVKARLILEVILMLA